MPIAMVTEVIPYITGWLSDILIMNFVKLLKSGASEFVMFKEGKIFEKNKSYPNLKPKVKINIDNRLLSSSPANLLLMNDPI